MSELYCKILPEGLGPALDRVSGELPPQQPISVLRAGLRVDTALM